jgi:hypothetical protein
MSKINPKASKNIFTEDVINALPDNKKLGYGIGAAKRTQDPNWKENQAKAQIKRSQNTVWWNKKQVAQQQLENNPAYITRRQEGIDRRTNSIEWRKNQLEGAKRNAIENTEWQKNRKEGTRRSLAKPCITPYGIFFTGADAGRKYNELYNIKTGITRISKFLKTNKEGYYYITKVEYTKLTGKEL